MNWGVYILGITLALIVWGATGNLFAGAFVGIAVRVIGGAITGAKWS